MNLKDSLAALEKLTEQIENHELRGLIRDILEDTGVSLGLLVEMFGTDCADYVWAVTDEPGVNRKERKAKTYPKIRGNETATRIKLADRIANVGFSIETKNERMFRMYKKEHPEFVSILRTNTDTIDPLYYMWEHLDAEMGSGLLRIK